MTNIRTEHFTAEDGVQVGYHVAGSGDPIVIVHGSISAGRHWFGVVEQLAADHACYVLDRRGRDASSDSENYSLATEADDITTLLGIAGADDAVLLGHSYGAIATLEAVRRGAAPRKLALYEPPLPYESPTAGEHLAPYAEAIGRGDNEAAMLIACDHFLRVPRAETALYQQSPLWPDLLALAPTWTRELREIDLTTDRLDAYAALSLPTLLLIGSLSPAHLVGASHWLQARMPDATVVTLPDQGHLANVLAPHLVADAVAAFAAG